MSDKIYQWVKGDYAGKVVRWEGKIEEVEGVGVFLIFNDGTRANENLLNDFFLEINSEDDLILMPESKYLPPENNPPLQLVTETPKVPTSTAVVSPIHSLLLESKKTKTTVNIGLVVDMPPSELMRVLADSYDDGEKKVLEYIATTLDVEDIKQQIAKQVWLSAFTNKPKRQRNAQKE